MGIEVYCNYIQRCMSSDKFKSFPQMFNFDIQTEFNVTDWCAFSFHFTTFYFHLPLVYFSLNTQDGTKLIYFSLNTQDCNKMN
jgi:hypothetical protein